MNRFEMTDTVIVPETLITPASPIKSPARKGVVATPKKGTPAAGDSKGKSPQSISNRPDPSTPSKLPNKKKVA